MTGPSSIQFSPDADRARLGALEVELAQRESDLARFKVELSDLQQRYLDEIGVLYAQLSGIESACIEMEIAQGLRAPVLAEDDDEVDPETYKLESCTNRSEPTDDLKRVFRDLAKTIHPDLAMDEPARYRRHSLMAEANRAYAERDADRLRLILRAWERNPDALFDDSSEDAQLRVSRRVVEIDQRLIEIDAELAELRRTAIWRLKGKIDQARAQGWDLFTEMLLQVKRDISRSMARRRALEISAREGGEPPSVFSR